MDDRSDSHLPTPPSPERVAALPPFTRGDVLTSSRGRDSFVFGTAGGDGPDSVWRVDRADVPNPSSIPVRVEQADGDRFILLHPDPVRTPLSVVDFHVSGKLAPSSLEHLGPGAPLLDVEPGDVFLAAGSRDPFLVLSAGETLSALHATELDLDRAVGVATFLSPVDVPGVAGTASFYDAPLPLDRSKPQLLLGTLSAEGLAAVLEHAQDPRRVGSRMVRGLLAEQGSGSNTRKFVLWGSGAPTADKHPAYIVGLRLHGRPGPGRHPVDVGDSREWWCAIDPVRIQMRKLRRWGGSLTDVQVEELEGVVASRLEVEGSLGGVLAGSNTLDGKGGVWLVTSTAEGPLGFRLIEGAIPTGAVWLKNRSTWKRKNVHVEPSGHLLDLRGGTYRLLDHPLTPRDLLTFRDHLAASGVPLSSLPASAAADIPAVGGLYAYGNGSTLVLVEEVLPGKVVGRAASVKKDRVVESSDVTLGSLGSSPARNYVASSERVEVESSDLRVLLAHATPSQLRYIERVTALPPVADGYLMRGLLAETPQGEVLVWGALEDEARDGPLVRILTIPFSTYDHRGAVVTALSGRRFRCQPTIRALADPPSPLLDCVAEEELRRLGDWLVGEVRGRLESGKYIWTTVEFANGGRLKTRPLVPVAYEGEVAVCLTMTSVAAPGRELLPAVSAERAEDTYISPAVVRVDLRSSAYSLSPRPLPDADRTVVEKVYSTLPEDAETGEVRRLQHVDSR